MIRVSEYEPLQRGKISVRLDNGIRLVLYRSEAKLVHIAPEGEITEEDYRRLLEEILAKRAKKRAMHLLERMDRTEHELRGKLADGGYPAECIDCAIEYVSQFHYLDDYRYAKSFIRLKMDRYSKRQMQMKLLGKGLNRDLIDRALEETYTVDETVQIRNLLAKRKFDPACEEKEFARIYRYLVSRGFGGGMVLRIMHNYEPFGSTI